MVTQELRDYITAQRIKGISDTDTKSVLLKNNWKEKDVDNALKSPMLDNFETNDNHSDGPKNMFDVSNMQWYDGILLIPSLLLFIGGGAIDIIFALIGGAITVKIIQRRDLSFKAKLGRTLLVTIGLYLAYFATAIVFVYVIFSFLTW